MSELASRISSASGDAGALLALAIDMAEEIARLKAQAAMLQSLNDERKAAQAARTRKHRNAVSRDVTLQDVTGCDTVPPSSPPFSSFPTPHITLTTPPSPSAPRLARSIRVVSPPDPDVGLVLAHYRSVHRHRRPGPKDEKAIAKALAFGFSAADLCDAIDGNAADGWHREKHKHDLPYVLRDSGQIDNFREKSVTPPILDEFGCFTEYGERITRPAGVGAP